MGNFPWGVVLLFEPSIQTKNTPPKPSAFKIGQRLRRRQICVLAGCIWLRAESEKKASYVGVRNTPFREQEEAQQQARSKTVPHVFAFFVARLFAFLTCFCMCHILERALAKGLSQKWLHNFRLKSIE